MKKIIILIVIAGISLNGCYDLNTYPGDKLNQGLFWKTADQAKQAMMGVYAVMRDVNAYGVQFQYDMLGDIAYGFVANYNFNNYLGGNYTDRDNTLSAKWQTTYEGIQSANNVIRHVSNMSSLDEDTKGELIAEAKFLRALFYFTLLDLWGGVPYYDETTNVNADYANMKKPRSTADEIRSYILSDLNEAISKLRVTWTDSDYGRATKGAAYALRGKVYLYNQEWKNAISDFEEVIYNKSNNYGYGLDPDYANIFKLYNGAKSNEMIFAIQNKSGVGTNYGMPYNLYLGTRNSYGSCRNFSMPSTAFVDMYEYPDGKPFNWEDIFPGYNDTPTANGERAAKRMGYMSVQMTAGKVTGLRNADTTKILNAYKNRDPRLMATIIVPYSTYKGWAGNLPKDMLFALDNNTQGNASAGTMQNDAGWITYFWRKFVTEYDLGGVITSREQIPFAFPLIRYADVLLMLSEAYNENGQLDKSIIELNKVRTRPSVHMPGLNSGPEWLAVTTKDQMTERIRKERAIELAIEGHRFSDLRRWGIAVETLSNVVAVNIWGNALYTHKFTQRDTLWPIPAVEIERNPALVQNPGW